MSPISRDNSVNGSNQKQFIVQVPATDFTPADGAAPREEPIGTKRNINKSSITVEQHKSALADYDSRIAT